ncbi:MAG: DinB family protein [Caldilineaceae bacterium]
MPTPNELADNLERSYASLWRTLSLLEEDERDRPCLHEGWLPKALLAHVAFWDDYQTRRMMAALNGESAVNGFPRPQEDNDERAAADAARNWDEIAELADGYRQRMIDFARSLREDQLIAYPEGDHSLDLSKLLAHMSHHVLEHAGEVYRYCTSLDRWGRDGLRRFIAAQSNHLLDSIGALDEETLTTVPVCGMWSVRDVIAHVTAWDEYALEIVRQWPNFDLSTMTRWTESGDIDVINARLHAERADLDMIAVLDQAATVHRRLLRAYDRLSDDDLRSEGDFGLGLKGTVSYLLFFMAQHAAEHAAEIWEWRERMGG